MPVRNRTDPRVLQDGAYSLLPFGAQNPTRLWLCIGQRTTAGVTRFGFEDQQSLRVEWLMAQEPKVQRLKFVRQGLPQTPSERRRDRDEMTAVLG